MQASESEIKIKEEFLKITSKMKLRLWYFAKTKDIFRHAHSDKKNSVAANNWHTDISFKNYSFNCV